MNAPMYKADDAPACGGKGAGPLPGGMAIRHVDIQRGDLERELVSFDRLVVVRQRRHTWRGITPWKVVVLAPATWRAWVRR